MKPQTTFGINYVELVSCIICKRLFSRNQTNLLFMDKIQEIRVCVKCDNG